jgi:DNA replication and repair protein RecF
LYVTKLKLSNFRNYSRLDVNFAKNFNILYGKNAQGKTNILESLFMCASGRSQRTSKDMELVKIDENGFYIRVAFIKDGNESDIEIACDKNEKKKIKINEIPAKRLGSLMGNLNVVIFSPENLLIVKEGPSERRRFLDIALSQIRPSYFYDLQQYIKILGQRNTLLKTLQQNEKLIETLEIWNSNLVKVGARIIRSRNQFIKRLSSLAETNHAKLTSNKERLSIAYNPSIKCEGFEDILQIEKEFFKSLEGSVKKEIFLGSTLHGPQRDDYNLILNGISLKNYGSQGQQRTAVLSLKLSEIDILKEETNEFPILLLDDVMSELDKSRQEYLLDNLKGIQTFITTTDKSFFDERELSNSKFFEVNSGEIVMENDA